MQGSSKESKERFRMIGFRLGETGMAEVTGSHGENGETGGTGDLDQFSLRFPRCPRFHRVDPLPPQPPLAQAHRKPCFESGSDRTRVPDAAKMALATAGSTGGSDGSPRPVGGLFDFSQCTSITGGACAMRSSGT